MKQMDIFNYIATDDNYEINLEDLHQFLKNNFAQYEWKKDDVFKGFVYRTKKRDVHASITNMYDGSIKLGCGFQNKGGSWHGCCGAVNTYDELKTNLERYLEKS